MAKEKKHSFFSGPRKKLDPGAMEPRPLCVAVWRPHLFPKNRAHLDYPAPIGYTVFNIMKLIPLSKGQFTKVDDEDLENLLRFKWHADARVASGKFYASSTSRRIGGKQTRISMHRLIMGAPRGMVVDHINHDSLDNRKSNLRICSVSQNGMNRSGAPKSSKSGIRGVFYYKPLSKWQAHIRVNNKLIFLGRFESKDAAIAVRRDAVKKYFGEFGGLE